MRNKIICLLVTFLMSNLIFAGDWDFEGETEELGETVITTDGFETTVKDVSKNLFVITKKEIEDKNAADVWDVIRDIPGVNLIYTSSGYLIDMRGQGERAKYNVAILIDGVQINPIDVHSAAPISTIPLNSIERIEVIPGSGSVVYGNGAAGGVINVITKKNFEKKAYGDLYIRYGSYNNKNLGINLGKKLGTSFNVSGGFNILDSEGYQDIEEAKEKSGDLGFSWDVNSKNRLSFKLSKFKGEHQEAESLTQEQIDDNRTQSGYEEGDSISNSDQDRDDYRVTYDLKINDDLIFTTTGYSAETETSHFDDDSLSSIFSDNRDGILSKFQYKYNENSKVVIGHDFIDIDAKRDYRHMSHVYSTYEFEFGKKVNSIFTTVNNKFGKAELTQGMRFENAEYTVVRNTISAMSGQQALTDVDRVQDNYAFDTGINYHYSDTLNIYTRFEKGYVSPSPNQFLEKKQDSSYALNMDLKSEAHNTFEIGMRDYINDMLFVNGTVFFTKSEDEIIIQRLYGSGMSDPYKYVNIAESEKIGGELFLEEYLGNMTIEQKLTYVNSEITDGDNKGKKVPYVPEVILGLGIKLDINDYAKLIVNTEYRDDYYLDEDNSENLKQDSYTVTNLKTSYKIKNMTLNTGINNIFDTKYNTYSNGTDFIPAPERNYFAEVKYSF